MAVSAGTPVVGYSLAGSIVPTRVSPAYRLGLLVVALAMLMLPLIYLGLIAAVGATVWWHLGANTWIITGPGGGGIWRLVGYLAPAIAGLVMMFFMVKPVLARPARPIDPVPIKRDDAPALYALIDEICRQVRAPTPDRVLVDCRVNASAGFAATPLLPRRPPMLLIIGLPLAAGLTVRELGGVLAHEFGHFAQGGGMRLTAIVRSINGWFARVVGERDEWDDKLERWSSQGIPAIVVPLKLAEVSVRLSRFILSGLMRLGHGVSCFMLRQMEYDADSYQIKLVGSTTFTETSARMRELTVGADLGYQHLHESWLRKALPANLPAFLIRQCDRLTASNLEQIRQVPAAEAGLFDTHPSDADRTRAANRAGAVGILAGGNGPARELFQHFDALASAATRHHYEHDLRLQLDSVRLMETEAVLSTNRNREDHQRSVHAFFGDRLTIMRPMRVAWPLAIGSAGHELIEESRASRREMQEVGRDIARKYRLLESFERTRTLTATAFEVFGAGFSEITPSDFDMTESSSEDARATEQRAIDQQQALIPELLPFESAASRRIACGLALSGEEVTELVAAFNALADVWPHLNELARQSLTLQLLAANAPKSPNPTQAAKSVDRATERVRILIGRIRKGLGERTAPADGTPVRLTQLLAIPFELSGGNEQSVITSAAVLRADLLGRLCTIALRGEETSSET